MRLKLIINDLLAKIISIILPAKLMKNKRYFRLWENKNYHITPVHFYEPVPDTRTLDDDLWLKRSELIGIDINE